MHKYKIALAVPCFERPQRTMRAIQNVLAQDMDGWEVYFIGDKCPYIQSLVDSGEANALIAQAAERGNKLAIFNLPIHYGHWGYQARNLVFKLSDAEYTMFMDNDDVILPNHFSNYYNAIADSLESIVYFNTWLDPIENANAPKGQLRESALEFGKIGHQEIIVQSELLKFYNEKPEWGHDWELVNYFLQRGVAIKKSDNPPTYHIMSVGELREQGID